MVTYLFQSPCFNVAFMSNKRILLLFLPVLSLIGCQTEVPNDETLSLLQVSENGRFRISKVEVVIVWVYPIAALLP